MAGLVIWAGSAVSASTLPPVAEMLSRIQANLDAFQAAVPDFVADERVLSKQTVEGAVKHQDTTDSLFTCVRKFQQDRTRFIESREVHAVNGKPAGGAKKLKGPVVFRGAFVGLLRDTFSSGNVEHHNYTLVGMEPIAGKDAIVVAFKTKPGQGGFRLNGRMYDTHDTGKAWLDAESFQILKVERTYSNMPEDEIVMRVEYSPVNVEGRTLLMPRTVYGSDRKVKSKKSTLYEFTAEYRNYRKFSVSSEINYSVK